VSYDLESINREQAHSETDPFTEGRYRQFARHLGTRFAGRVLDVGCNTGRGGCAFLAAAPRAVIDGVELLADRISRIPPGVYRAVREGTLADVPNAAGPYDALLMGELIEHVPLSAVDDLIGHAGRLLAPSGRLLLTTPNPHYVMLGKRSGGTVLGGAHVSVHCPAALGQYVAWKGFRIEAITGSGRVSGIAGSRLPLALYGSYLLAARKPVGA
jgi:2-polyprenyl-3-methyl-5-hydroxy-6-metoxy-1,4-benzoquinol methylase